MAIDPASARIYAQIALSDAGDAGSVGEMVVAVRRRDPWLTVRAEPDACALPNAGDLGAAERFSTYAAGIWKEPDGTVGVTVGSISDGGTLTRTALGTRWTPFSITFTPEDGLRRVGRCPR